MDPKGMVLVSLLLLVITLSSLTSGLVLDRRPRQAPSSRTRFSFQNTLDDDDDFADSGGFDASSGENKGTEIGNLGLKPSWKSFYPYPTELHSFRREAKRDTRVKEAEASEKDQHELASILKDEEDDASSEDKKAEKKKPVENKDATSHHGKTKRQSSEVTEPKLPELEALTEQEELVETNPDFKDWLRREYYRNMAKSFASMRRKRDGNIYSEGPKTPPAAPRNRRPKKSVTFEEVTDNLKAIEDVLFLDALQTIREAENDYEEDPQKQNRITNDLSSAYDLETMRNALFRLRETLGNMEKEPVTEEGPFYKVARKRGEQCAPLDLLTSDCSSLGDIVSDGPLKRLLLHACNWHEVCYTCGEVFGLTSENCDVGFIEQSQTICHGDVPCESTASLLLLPLRQRRVFYKRSNPNVCLIDSCVEDFLKQGQ